MYKVGFEGENNKTICLVRFIMNRKILIMRKSFQFLPVTKGEHNLYLLGTSLFKWISLHLKILTE